MVLDDHLQDGAPQQRLGGQLEKEITKIEVDNKHQFLKLSYKAKKTEQDIYLERQSNRNLKNALDKEKELNDLKTKIINLEDENIQLKKKDIHLEKVIASLGKKVRKYKMLEVTDNLAS